MYRITDFKTGETIGLVEKPLYIKTQRNGCYGRCSEEEAIGIAYKSTPYALAGRGGLGNCQVVHLVEFDGGQALETQGKELAEAKERLAQVDDAAIEMYEAILAQEEINRTTDEALIELFEATNKEVS